jgi:hypothetical protein
MLATMPPSRGTLPLHFARAAGNARLDGIVNKRSRHAPGLLLFLDPALGIQLWLARLCSALRCLHSAS